MASKTTELKRIVNNALTIYGMEMGGDVNELPLNDVITIKDDKGEVEVHAVTRSGAVRWSGNGEVAFSSISEESINELTEHIKDEYEID